MIEVALFGAGRIGAIHAGNIARQPGVRLKYVVDVDAAAATKLAQSHVGCGRLDGFIELQLSIWDAIGALVIVDEAGGRSAPFLPSPVTAKAPCLASTPGIFDALARMSEIPTT